MKKIAFALCALLLPAAFLLPARPASAVDNTETETVWDDVCTFDTAEEVEEKFVFHFVSEQNDRRADKLAYSWKIEDGAIVRTNNVDASRDTINIAILTYTGATYDDFELSVDFAAGSKTGFWGAVGIRQQIPGKYYTTPGGGTGIFMQQKPAKITFWGPLTNGIYEKDIPAASSYYPSQWHNMRILAEGTSVTVWVDGEEVAVQSVNNTDYAKGYISLQSVNNDCRFDNFKIRSLGSSKAAGNEENKGPDAEAGTPLESYIQE